MKQWILIALVALIVVSGAFVLYQRLTPASSMPQSGLMRTPNSAYKYDLCTEAYAFAYATPDNPYKTDFTFRDPFRKANDTITPRLLDYNPQTRTVNFSVRIVINQVATFQEVILHVHELDGISVMLPDKQNQLRHSTVPQFIISSLGRGAVAVLDYTCPNQWIWRQT